MTQELEAAIFDFGGVLTTSVLESFRVFEEELGLPQGALLDAFRAQAAEGDPPYFLLEKGLISEDEFYRSMFESLRGTTGADLEYPDDPRTVRRKLFGALRPNEEMIAAAISIAGHYRTAILTNNVKEWADWREIASAHQFHLVIDSSEVGMRKPEPGIYLLTCERLGVRPERAAFVDDISANVEGARAVGLHAIQFTNTAEVLGELGPLFPRAFEETPAHA